MKGNGFSMIRWCLGLILACGLMIPAWGSINDRDEIDYYFVKHMTYMMLVEEKDQLDQFQNLMQDEVNKGGAPKDETQLQEMRRLDKLATRIADDLLAGGTGKGNASPWKRHTLTDLFELIFSIRKDFMETPPCDEDEDAICDKLVEQYMTEGEQTYEKMKNENQPIGDRIDRLYDLALQGQAELKELVNNHPVGIIKEE